MTTGHIEDRYQAELASTEIGPFTARLLTWSFVAILFSIPLVQMGVDLRRGHMPHAEDLQSAASVAKAFFQPRIQLLITALGRYGNDTSTLGRNGWLFYQLGIDYVAGPDIVDKKQLAATIKKKVDKQGAHDPSPDPRPAILGLAADCRRLGIRLIVTPIPDKAMLQPAQATSAFSAGGIVPNNAGYGQLLSELRAHGVELFDVIPPVLVTQEPYFLKQDTHWTPQFMEDSARKLARYISPASAPTSGWTLKERRVSRLGDLVDMLKLPVWQKIFSPQEVTIRQVVQSESEKHWEPDSRAVVLLLGDSFTNIYSQSAIGWGESAGFAEHLSYELGQPVDVISQNGGGVTGTRSELARPENASRLTSKKVLVYEFAMRDLLGQYWKPIPLSGVKGRSEAEQLIVLGHILKSSRVPQPGSAPYADCLTFVQFQVESVESGTYTDHILLAAFWGMRNNVWLPAASYVPGDRFRLKLIPLRNAESRARTVQRADDTDDFDHLPYFVMSEEPLKR